MTGTSYRTSVSSLDLEELADAVARAHFLNGDASDSPFQLLDPSCMLEALADVYAASLRLVRESDQWSHGRPFQHEH